MELAMENNLMQNTRGAMMVLTFPKYLSRISTYRWMISKTMSSLSSASQATQKNKLAYLKKKLSIKNHVFLYILQFNTAGYIRSRITINRFYHIMYSCIINELGCSKIGHIWRDNPWKKLSFKMSSYES